MKKINWGIIGTGNIANKFTSDLKLLCDANVSAVASRDINKAQKFADNFGIKKYYGSYQDLVNDKDIDVVYVSTPHVFHRDNTLMALQAGKAVLCEKPLSINYREAKEMVDAATSKKVFFMEAMWMRFTPAIVKLKNIIESGTIGKVRIINADFGYKSGRVDPMDRVYNKALGGGALLDIGIYPVSLSFMLLGVPQKISSYANIGTTGVDEQCGIMFSHSNGEIAILSAAVSTTTSGQAYIYGDNGYVKISCPWWCSKEIFLHKDCAMPERISIENTGNGFVYQAQHVMDCIKSGCLQSDVMSWNESLEIMKTMDQIRKPWGLVYDSDKLG